jgi:nitroreductase
MDLFDAIAKRHSYRGGFTAAAVPRADLEKIVQAGIQAPSGKNEQVVSFVIVDDPALLKEIAGILNKPVCNAARAMIACIVDPRPVHEGVSFGVEDCSASVENMLLAITALGYASVWLDYALREHGNGVKIGALLGVPEDKSVRILLPLGVPVEAAAQREKLLFGRRAWFNRYDGCKAPVEQR